MIPTHKQCFVEALKSKGIYLLALPAAVFVFWALLSGLDKHIAAERQQHEANRTAYRKIVMEDITIARRVDETGLQLVRHGNGRD